MTVNITTAVTAKAATYNLTDLETIHDELGIKNEDTSKDSWLDRANTQVSEAINEYCGQPLVVEALTDTFYFDKGPEARMLPGSGVTLQLSRFPVISVISASILILPATQYPLVEGTDFILNSRNGQLIRLNPITGTSMSWKEVQVTVSYVAGQGAIAAEDYTVAGATPSYSVANAAAFSIDQGVIYVATGLPLAAVAANPAQGQYSVDNDPDSETFGTYAFSEADDGQALSVSYGWNKIKANVVAIVLSSVTGRYKAKDRDPMQMSVDQPGIGLVRYWIPNNDGAFAPREREVLDLYRTPTCA